MNKFDIGETVVFKEYEQVERTATFQNYSQSYGLEAAIKQRKPLEVVDIDVGIDGKAIQVYDPESKLDGVVEPQNFELYVPQATQTVQEATDYPEQAFEGYVAQLKNPSDTYPSDMFYAYSESTSVAGTKYTKHHLVSSVNKARIYKDKLTAQRAISKMNNASNLYSNQYKMRHVFYDPDKQMYTLHSEQSVFTPENKDEMTADDALYVLMWFSHEHDTPLFFEKTDADDNPIDVSVLKNDKGAYRARLFVGKEDAYAKRESFTTRYSVVALSRVDDFIFREKYGPSENYSKYVVMTYNAMFDDPLYAKQKGVYTSVSKTPSFKTHSGTLNIELHDTYEEAEQEARQWNKVSSYDWQPVQVQMIEEYIEQQRAKARGESTSQPDIKEISPSLPDEKLSEYKEVNGTIPIEDQYTFVRYVPDKDSLHYVQKIVDEDSRVRYRTTFRDSTTGNIVAGLYHSIDEGLKVADIINNDSDHDWFLVQVKELDTFLKRERRKFNAIDELDRAKGRIEHLTEENEALKERLEGKQEYIDKLMEMHMVRVEKKTEYKHKLEFAIEIIAKNELHVDGELIAELLKVKDV